MSFEPEKIFIGLVDFFSIFMPGALLAYVGKNWAVRTFVDPQGSYPLDSAEHLVVFLFASYLLGHFIFLVGSFLDNWIYSHLRSATRWGQIGRLAKGKKLQPRWLRRLAESHYLFGANADAALIRAQFLKTRALKPIAAAGAINTYQWAKAMLSRQHPEGLVAVQRLEADSKFFRSFVIALFILAPFLWKQHSPAAVVCLALVVPALLRYIDQRFKGTQQAYWFVLTLEALNEQKEITTAKRDRPTHAGGVVFKNGVKPLEYLLVKSSNNREWVLPKGKIELGENMRETAVREVLEETGCWARVRGSIGDFDLGAPTRVYIMEFLEQTASTEDRECEWGSLEQAQELSSFDSTKQALAQAAPICVQLR